MTTTHDETRPHRIPERLAETITAPSLDGISGSERLAFNVTAIREANLTSPEHNILRIAQDLDDIRDRCGVLHTECYPEVATALRDLADFLVPPPVGVQS